MKLRVQGIKSGASAESKMNMAAHDCANHTSQGHTEEASQSATEWVMWSAVYRHWLFLKGVKYRNIF